MNPLGNSPSYLPEMYSISGSKTFDIKCLSSFATLKFLETLIEQNSRDQVQQWILEDLTGKTQLSWQYPNELSVILGEIYLKGLTEWQETDLRKADLYLNYAKSNLNLMENRNEQEEHLLKICIDLTQPLRCNVGSKTLDTLNLTELRHLTHGFQSSHTLDRIIELYSYNSLQHIIELLKGSKKLGNEEESALDAIFLAEISLKGLGEVVFQSINPMKALHCLKHAQEKLKKDESCGWEEEQLQIHNALIPLLLQHNKSFVINSTERQLIINYLMEKQQVSPLPSGPDGHTILHIAIMNNDLQTVLSLKTQLGDDFISEINRPIKNGRTPIFFASNIEMLSVLLQSRANINVSDRDEITPLRVFVPNNSLLTSFLESSLANLIDFRKKDVFQENLLHFMVKENYVDQVVSFKQEYPKLVEEWLNEKNIYGESPLDLAWQFKRDAMICQFLGVSSNEVISSLKYGVKPVHIDQKTIKSKMWDYMKLHSDNRKIPSIPGGLCNGFVLLYLYHAELGKTAEFYEILKTLSGTDLSSLEQLKQQKLPDILSSIYQNLDDLFEQMINDIIWLQASYKDKDHPLRELNKDSIQHEVEFLFGLVKGSSVNIENSFSHTTSMSEECLAEWFAQIVKQGAQTFVTISDVTHLTGCFVTPDAKLKYYDPNESQEVVACDPKELASLIFTTRYNNSGRLSEDHKVPMTLGIYHINQQSSFKHIIDDENEQISPNGFSPMHRAVFNGDIETVKKLLEDLKDNPNRKDYNSILSPLQLAIGLKKKEIASTLIENPAVDINENDQFSLPLFQAVMSNNEELFLQLLKKDNLNTRGILSYIVKNDRNNLLQCLLELKPNIIDSREGSIEALKEYKTLPRKFHEGLLSQPLKMAIHRRNEQAVALLMQYGAKQLLDGDFEYYAKSISHCPDIGCIKAFINNMPDINQKNLHGDTLLLFAVKAGNYVLVKQLIENGADKDLAHDNGFTPLKLAMMQIGGITDPDDNRVKIYKLLI